MYNNIHGSDIPKNYILHKILYLIYQFFKIIIITISLLHSLKLQVTLVNEN